MCPLLLDIHGRLRTPDGGHSSEAARKHTHYGFPHLRQFQARWSRRILATVSRYINLIYIYIHIYIYIYIYIHIWYITYVTYIHQHTYGISLNTIPETIQVWTLPKPVFFHSLRPVQLSDDTKRLIWYSGAKRTPFVDGFHKTTHGFPSESCWRLL